MTMFDYYDALFDENTELEVKTSKIGLRYIDINEHFRIMEQNAAKDSKYAQMARDGKKVAWIFKDGKYKYVVVDGWMKRVGG